MVRGIPPRIDLKSVEITATGAFPSSIRSDDISRPLGQLKELDKSA